MVCSGTLALTHERQRDVTYEEASQFAEEHGLVFLETSAKTGENVDDAFMKTAQVRRAREGTFQLTLSFVRSSFIRVCLTGPWT